MTFSFFKESIIHIWKLVWGTWAESTRSSPESARNSKDQTPKNFPAVALFSPQPALLLYNISLKIQ